MKHLFFIFFLGVWFFGFLPGVFAYDSATTHLPSSINSWNTYGSPAIFGDRITLVGSKKQGAFFDIDAKDLKEDYILIASYVDKDDSRPSYSSSDRKRSGNPYLYGYYIDKQGNILKYLTGSETISTSRSNADSVVYGIFPPMSKTKTIRIFLKQSSVKNISNSGVDVTFIKPILVSASSTSRAKDLLSAYADQSLSLNNQSNTTGSSTNTSSGSIENCKGTSGKSLLTIGFEANESKNTSLKFGSSLASWFYGVHDYPASVSPYEETSSLQSYVGDSSLMLKNPTYGYQSGEEATSPQLYDEALRYLTTGKLEKGTTYVFSAIAKYMPGSSKQTSVQLLFSQEIGTDGNGELVQTKTMSVANAWTCLEFTFTNHETKSTEQDLAIFFGNLPKGSTLYVDNIQMLKK